MSPSTDTREYRESACELKFLVNLATSEALRLWARTHLQPDPHSDGESGDGYRITSLYFDTEHFDVFHRRGSFGRSKYRVRRYGTGEIAFLERKLKTKGLLAKRRSIVHLERLGLLHGPTPVTDPDAFWFHRRLLARRLRPICQITYRRTARFALTDLGPIRMTLDDDLRALPVQALACDESRPAEAILPEHRVLELKFRGELPGLFRSLLQEFSLAPKTFSKYRHAARTLGCVPATEPAAAVPHPHPDPDPAPVAGNGHLALPQVATLSTSGPTSA